MKVTCRECGEVYSGNGGGHCPGGRWGGCCRTFTSDAAFDAHRWGDYSAERFCINVASEPGWRHTPRGWTNSKPLTDEERARLAASRPRPASQSAEQGDPGTSAPPEILEALRPSQGLA